MSLCFSFCSSTWARRASMSVPTPVCWSCRAWSNSRWARSTRATAALRSAIARRTRRYSVTTRAVTSSRVAVSWLVAVCTSWRLARYCRSRARLRSTETDGPALIVWKGPMRIGWGSSVMVCWLKLRTSSSQRSDTWGSRAERAIACSSFCWLKASPAISRSGFCCSTSWTASLRLSGRARGGSASARGHARARPNDARTAGPERRELQDFSAMKPTRVSRRTFLNLGVEPLIERLHFLRREQVIDSDVGRGYQDRLGVREGIVAVLLFPLREQLASAK